MIKYKNGDLLKSDCNVICHQVNCQGVMGSGIAKTIRAKYPIVYLSYLQKHKNQGSKLGSIDVVKVDGNIGEKRWVVNLYAQEYYLPRGINHTNYDMFRKCIKALKQELSEYVKITKAQFKIGFPYGIGCGLAGGNWEIVKKILETEFGGAEWNVEIWKL